MEAHTRALEACGATAVSVRTPEDLYGLDALILPGGESTTISKGMDREGLVEPICAFARAGHPTFGTCAGAILLAQDAKNHPVPTLGLLAVTALRNAYGTQLDSFTAEIEEVAWEEFADFHAVFIRAPQIVDLGPEVEILARVEGRPVLVRQANIWAATFHPELTPDPRIHAAFLSTISRP